MLQKEVAERIVAPPGGKEYSPLSIFIQLFLDVSIRFFIKPSAFFPPPKIESAVVHLGWKEKLMIEKKDEEWFKKMSAFQSSLKSKPKKEAEKGGKEEKRKKTSAQSQWISYKDIMLSASEQGEAEILFDARR
jgi:16S rRNA (adenine1518-N6/adenine1519-N6)-dimethyltransferase